MQGIASSSKALVSVILALILGTFCTNAQVIPSLGEADKQRESVGERAIEYLGAPIYPAPHGRPVIQICSRAE